METTRKRKPKQIRSGDVALVVAHLPSNPNALNSNPIPPKKTKKVA
jgi:hypothetical protein